MDTAIKGTRWVQFIAILFGSFITINAMVFQAPALPIIAKHFGISTHLSGLFILSFYIVSATLYPITGRLADQYGRKRVLTIGLAIFATFEFIAAFSPTFSFLLLTRVGQAIGVSAIFPISIAYIGVLFSAEERGKASGILDAAQGIGSLIGALLAGFLIKTYGWPVIYYVSGVTGAVALFVVLAFVQESKGEAKGSLDFIGFLLLFITTGSILSVSTLVETFGMSSPYTLGTLGLGVLTAILLWFTENRIANPLVELSLLKIRLFAWISIIYVLFVAGMQAFVYAMNFFLATRPGGDVAEAGLYFFVLYGAGIVGGLVFGTLSDKVNNKKLLITALSLPVLSLFLFAGTVSSGTPFMHIAILTVLFGLGSVIPIVFRIGITLIPAHKYGAGSGLLAYLRDFGAPFGSVTGIILFSNFTNRFTQASLLDSAKQVGINPGLMDAVKQAGLSGGKDINVPLLNELQSLGLKFEDLLSKASNEGISIAMQHIFLIVAAIFILLVIFSFFIPQKPRETSIAADNQADITG